jgi:hypothetical protein
MPNIDSAIRAEVARIKKKISSLETSTQAEVSRLQARARKLVDALAALGADAKRAKGSSGRARRGANMERVARALRAGALGAQDLAKRTGIAIANLRQTLFAMTRNRRLRRVRKGVYALAGVEPKRARKAASKTKRSAKKAVRKARKTAKRAATAAAAQSAA